MIARIALEQKDTARAIKALEAVMRVDHSDVESARKLAELVAPLGDAARAEDAYRRLVAIDPFDANAEAAARPAGAQAQGRGDRRALVPERPRLEPARPRPGARGTGRGALAAGQYAEAKRRHSRRSRSRRPSSARRICC